MYRLYVDEVGGDDLTHVDKDKHRYLSLTGVAMTIDEARDNLGPRMDLISLRTHNQKMTVAAIQIALMKVCAHRSYRVAMRLQSFSLPNMRSTRLRCL